MKNYIFIMICLTIISCQNKSEQVESDTIEPVVQTSQLPGMPQDELVALFHATNEMDVQFLEKSFSMNAPGDLAKNMIRNISDVRADKTPCKEICYLFVKSNGEQIAHIGAFLDNGCSYFIFYENSRPKYINGMTQGGIDTFNKILSQVSTSPK